MSESNEKQYAVINLSQSESAPWYNGGSSAYNSALDYPRLMIDRRGWVRYGHNNLFPQEIINLNSRSPVNGAIIDSKVTYMCGNGVNKNSDDTSNYIGVPNMHENWDELFEKIAHDYATFGGFCVQVIVNKGGSSVSLFHQDFSNVRLGLLDEYGNAISYRIANDWRMTAGKGKPIELQAWKGSVKEAEKGKPYLYYHMDYRAGLKYYPIPSYYPALEYIKADGELAKFYNNSIHNGFTPSVVVSMPSNPSQDKKAEFQQQMERAFSGSRGASSIVVLWGENDTIKPNITPFNASANADIYNNVESIVFQKIVSAHRLSSPTLAGVAGSGNLSGNAAEIIDSFILYNYTVIDKMRRKILEHLNIFTKINGTSELIIEDLAIVEKIKEYK